MFKEFEQHITNHLPFLIENKLLIAISGGVDSVVLAHLCHSLKLNVALAHCNYNLRGKESDNDEAFVLELAKKLELEVYIKHFETELYAEKSKQSIQMAARELRYDWFKKLSLKYNYNYVLTAHHADDNLETFLINLTRGTGIEGLKGIPLINENVVRPLLAFSRKDVTNYAKKLQLKWREDSSNKSTKYLRNKLRHEVIPSLKETSPKLLQNFKQTLNNLSDTSVIVKEGINAILERVIIKTNKHKVVYDISEFKKLETPRIYLYEIFKSYGFTAWKDVFKLLDAQSGKQVLSNTHRLLKDRNCLILTKIVSEGFQKIISVNSEVEKVDILKGYLLFNTIKKASGSARNCIYVDKELLKFPLTVRNWKEGDYFYPVGMQGKKKLSKFFKDEKFSLLDKENVQLLCSENDIVWIIGKRADNRFKVSNKTKKILKITLQE